MQSYWPTGPAPPGLAVADLRAGQDLELERDVLGDVAGPGAVAKSGDEAATPAERTGVIVQRRQEGDQRVVEPRDPVGRELLQHAEIDEHPDDRLARPVVRAAQDARLQDPEGRSRTGPGACLGPPGGATGAGGWSGLGHVGPPGLRRILPDRTSWRPLRRPPTNAGLGLRPARDGGDQNGSRPAANGA